MQTMPANGAWKNSALRDTANTPGLGVAAGDYHRPLDLSAEFPATVSETPRVVGDIGRLSSRPNRGGRQPAFPRCSGGEVGVRRPRTAKASVQSTNSRGYLLVGQNIRAEWRSFITCSRSNMSHLPLHFSLGSLGSHVHPTGESPRLKKCRWGREWLPYRRVSVVPACRTFTRSRCSRGRSRRRPTATVLTFTTTPLPRSAIPGSSF